MKILIADNAEEIVELLEDVLVNQGFDVDKAFDGKQAYEYLQVNSYDMAFLDHDMPEMTGLELMKHIKINYPKTKVVMITGYPSMSDFFVKAIGADEYVSKPFTLEQILEVIKKYGPENKK